MREGREEVEEKEEEEEEGGEGSFERRSILKVCAVNNNTILAADKAAGDR